MSKKEKAKKSNDDDDTKTIFIEYLKKNNRPFSAQLLVQCLQEKLGSSKTAASAQKLLDSLVQVGTITVKEFGKTKLYWPNQNDLATADSSTLSNFDKQISDLEKEQYDFSEKVKHLSSETKALQNSLTNEQLNEKIEQLTNKNQQLTEKLEDLKEGNIKLITKQEKIAAEKKLATAQAAWRARKRMCREIIDNLTETTNKKYKQLKEDCDIVTDSDCDIFLDKPKSKSISTTTTTTSTTSSSKKSKTTKRKSK
eukprot:TRINITY_DN3273_c0_g2_i2.p1 TRINITY_DN3273_c0_g2~~TRINITY_DN3273_c0_g2_i2.p1  ORF type:complete len:254 (+),score=132.97 TRINITY_DN3273_c0_g2_i2:62-823(+)